jgi:hypothetical protein
MYCELWPYVWLEFKSGFYSGAGYSGACTVTNNDQTDIKFHFFPSFYHLLVYTYRNTFIGLLSSANKDVALINDGSNEGWMSIGQKQRFLQNFSIGFPGPEGSYELDQSGSQSLPGKESCH